MLLTAPQDETVSPVAGASVRLHETHDAFARQNCAENRCIWLAMVSSVSPETEHTPAKVMTVSRELPAIPVGGDGARLWCPWAAAGPGRASRRGAERSEALASRAAGPSGAWNTRGATSNTINWAGRPRGADGERAGRPRGGRRSVGGGSDNCRIYSPARRSTSCMMRPHTALTHATAATPRTRERQGRICRKSSKP